MEKEQVMKIVEHILEEISDSERREFEEELLDWESSIMLRKNGPSVRCMITTNGKNEIIMIPQEVADFIRAYNKRS